jgi:hypothetical protein
VSAAHDKLVMMNFRRHYKEPMSYQ